MIPVFIPYTVGDKVNVGAEIGPIGYFKCKKCKKMALYIMEEGTLQNHIDGFIPMGRKRKSYIIECKRCGNFFTPKDGKEYELIKLTEKYPANIDFEEIENEISELYEKDKSKYTSPDIAIKQFPKDCVNIIAKGKPEKYQKAVFDSAVAHIYNKEWRKSTMGKIEKKANIITALIMIGIVLLIIGAIAGISALIRNASK